MILAVVLVLPAVYCLCSGTTLTGQGHVYLHLSASRLSILVTAKPTAYGRATLTG